MIVHIRVPEEIIGRLKSRAAQQDMGEYLWDNLLRSALYSHVY